ncbi:farnesol dehydrogenase-like [Stomoxys calcitrans]|uniref:Dehydrogenase n=1 Tax=Stomoxys calcitrans TaxID=35570 RepID=A0A1I8NTK8_STOCA|nr:farnesol dehydrogenase-like [Stomoxys calcitrans]
MERWQNKVAVVTGASSGIGAAIAKDFVLAGLKVVALARRLQRMEEIKQSLPQDKQSQLSIMYCNVTDPANVDKVFDQIIDEFGGIDVLVNNAGCAKSGQLVDMDLKDITNILHTNVLGVVHCTQRAFKSMKERNFAGHVIIVNSIAGHTVLAGLPMSVPNVNIYSPTKFAVRAITEMYRQEFHGLGTKIKISSISPGFTDTEILYGDVRAALGDCMLDAHDVSNAVLYILSTPPHVQIHDLLIKPLGEGI